MYLEFYTLVLLKDTHEQLKIKPYSKGAKETQFFSLMKLQSVKQSIQHICSIIINLHLPHRTHKKR